MATFSELLKSTFKSKDTEENIDIYFTRPCGLVLTLFYKALNIHPNIVTIIGILIGMVAAYFFYQQDFCSNLIGVLLLTIANFHDSADGQLARMTGKKTLVGRMLDGFSADAIFFCIYFAIFLRLYNEPIPFCGGYTWQWWGFLLCLAAGILGHSRQCAVADYYRQIHLFFLKGKEGSELDTSEAQTPIVEEAVKNKKWLDWAFFFNYRNYCRGQERVTPEFQRFYKAYLAAETKPEGLREEFLEGSRPLMKWTNFLTYNWRAISLFVACLSNIPWLYPVIELTVFNGVRNYMHSKHEKLSRKMYDKYLANG